MEENNLIQVGSLVCFAYFKDEQTRYSSGISLFIGKVKIASCFYDATRTKGDPLKFRVTSRLPTIKETIGWYETEEKAKAVCLEVARVFCKQLSEIPK